MRASKAARRRKAAAEARRNRRIRQCLNTTEWLEMNVGDLRSTVEDMKYELNRLMKAYKRLHPDDWMNDEIPF